MITFSVFLARLITFCAHRAPHTPCVQAPTVSRPSDMSELTPQLVAEWEAKLQDPEALTPGQRYGLEVKISKLQGTLGSSDVSDVVKSIARKELEETECRLESYSEPVPVEASTMPKWHSRFTDYSDISSEALEVAHTHLMSRIQKAHLIIGKVSHDYKMRGQLIDAGVWDWKAPRFQCAPKGTLKAYYAALRVIKREATSLEWAIEQAVRLEGLEVPDTITQWNTSGLCGPAGGEDTRRFPTLKGNLEWADILYMARSKPLDPKVVKCRQEALRWHDRVNGVNFLPHTQELVQVGF